MGTLAYPFEVRDSANTTTDNRETGLAPTVSNGKTIAASPATVLASTVTIVEVTGGHYAALYDPEANGDASFPIDCGAGLTNPNDRYLTLDLTRDSGRLLAGFNAAGQASLAPTGLDAIAVTEPTGRPTTFPGMVVWTFMRFANAVTRSTSALVVKKTGGATATTQAISDDGAGNEAQGAAS